jgi:hypothetical protein
MRGSTTGLAVDLLALVRVVDVDVTSAVKATAAISVTTSERGRYMGNLFHFATEQ